MKTPGLELTVLFALLFCIIAVILVAYNMGGSDWTTTGENVAYVSVGLIFFALVVGAVTYWRK